MHRLNNEQNKSKPITRQIKVRSNKIEDVWIDWSIFAISVVMMLVSFMPMMVMLVLRMSLLMWVESATGFRDLRGLASVGQRNVNGNGVFMVSGLSSNVVEFVCSGNNLSGNWNNFVRSVLMSNFSIDRPGQAGNQSNVLSSLIRSLNSS